MLKHVVAFLFVFMFQITFAITPDAALQMLMSGNDRYVKGKLEHPDQTSARREATEEGQKPFAIVLGCSDSRVVPEILFDQGMGDLFVVRVAGNVVTPVVMDSIDYAAKELGSCLLVVLGHQNCGAVKAVRDGQTQVIPAVAKLIEPAVNACKKNPSSTLDTCVELNVQNMRNELNRNPILIELIAQNKLKIVGAYYHLNSGKVELLSP